MILEKSLMRYLHNLSRGKEFDTRNGINIYVFGARTYAPDIARFGSPTTIGCRPTPTAAATRSTA